MKTVRAVGFMALIVAVAIIVRAQDADKLSLASVTVNVKSVVGGNPVQGTVTLNRPADDDVEVLLSGDLAGFGLVDGDLLLIPLVHEAGRVEFGE